jgi:hypothetical protein
MRWAQLQDMNVTAYQKNKQYGTQTEKHGTLRPYKGRLILHCETIIQEIADRRTITQPHLLPIPFHCYGSFNPTFHTITHPSPERTVFCKQWAR